MSTQTHHVGLTVSNDMGEKEGEAFAEQALWPLAITMHRAGVTGDQQAAFWGAALMSIVAALQVNVGQTATIQLLTELMQSVAAPEVSDAAVEAIGEPKH